MLVFRGLGSGWIAQVLLDMKSVGMTGEVEAFRKPLFQTFTMFVGMVAALLMHAAVRAFRLPFPGYDHDRVSQESFRSRVCLYLLLIVPAMLDLGATALCMYGLPYVDVSIYQMLRGAAIVFVALLKQFALGDRLKGYHWVGVFWNVVSIVIIGGVASLESSGDSPSTHDHDSGDKDSPMTGVILILLGALVQSLQYAFEEKVMSMENHAPPLLLIGMEGLWGTLVCAFVLYPVVYAIPGSDHGSYENPYNTYVLFCNSPEVMYTSVLYFFTIFFYNMFAILVTYLLSSVLRAILDNFRPVAVWIVDLVLFSITAGAFGERWTPWSWLQVAGMGVLLYGTAVYNAPGPTSVELRGRVVDCFLSFDYDDEIRTPLLSKEERMEYRSPLISPMLTPTLRKEERKEEMAAPYGATDGFQRRPRGHSFGA
mmetsp:Transcript_15528/g.59019  ORF Transcript_15528/g.59019 Transcript_15528/m.59019 type:complete len:426 (-) Transcript_15528:69-1346(-)